MNDTKSAKIPGAGPAGLPDQPEKVTDPQRLIPYSDDEGAILRCCEICVDAPGAEFSRPELSVCRLRSCKLAGADLFSGSFTDVVFESCDLSNGDLRDAYFRRCEFINCRLTGADLTGAVIKTSVFRDCAMSFIGLDEAKLDGVSFEGCDLGGASMRSCELRRTDFANCSLKNAVLFRTPLAGVDLCSCGIEGLSVSESLSELRGARIGFLQAPVIVKMFGIDVEY